MTSGTDIKEILIRNQYAFHPVIKFDTNTAQLVSMDFTSENKDLTDTVFQDAETFSEFIQSQLNAKGAAFGVGGYDELRTVYSRSTLFNSGGISEEPRRLHLGTDIWGQARTPVYAPLGGMVHSYAFNDHFGDYGATIILLHQLEGHPFYSLYGHLSLSDLGALAEGQYVVRGQEFAHFGQPHENGHWPPHLHFQLILDLGVYRGDYPGVCKFSERDKHLRNCPDPDLILQLNRYFKTGQ